MASFTSCHVNVGFFSSSIAAIPETTGAEKEVPVAVK